MSKYLIIANWKMNPATIEEARSLAKKIDAGVASVKNAQIFIAPPFPFIAALSGAVTHVKLAAQDVFWEGVGPFTGEVSWQQLKSLGVSMVIVGHSERRRIFRETDEMIAKKVKGLVGRGMRSVLCVGEVERKENEISDTIRRALLAAVANLRKNEIKNLIIAYEPVWAISTNPGARPDTPENAFRVGTYIRKIIAGRFGVAAGRRVSIVYGGSVTSSNIAAFLKEGKMDGALVGGASLKPEEFIRLVKNVE